VLSDVSSQLNSKLSHPYHHLSLLTQRVLIQYTSLVPPPSTTPAMAKIKEVRIKDEYGDDDDGSEDAVAPGESTPLLVSAGRSSDPTSSSAFEREQLFQSFRRQRSVARLSLRASSAVGVSAEDRSDLLTLDVAHPIDALAPLVPGGIARYYDREFVPYRQASLVKSVPAFAPYTRKARHRSFYLWWLNVSVYFFIVSFAFVCTTTNSMHFSLYHLQNRSLGIGGNHLVS
jgi:hypothetical protein